MKTILKMGLALAALLFCTMSIYANGHGIGHGGFRGGVGFNRGGFNRGGFFGRQTNVVIAPGFTQNQLLINGGRRLQLNQLNSFGYGYGYNTAANIGFRDLRTYYCPPPPPALLPGPTTLTYAQQAPAIVGQTTTTTYAAPITSYAQTQYGGAAYADGGAYGAGVMTAGSQRYTGLGAGFAGAYYGVGVNPLGVNVNIGRRGFFGGFRGGVGVGVNPLGVNVNIGRRGFFGGFRGGVGVGVNPLGGVNVNVGRGFGRGFGFRGRF